VYQLIGLLVAYSIGCQSSGDVSMHCGFPDPDRRGSIVTKAGKIRNVYI
jgi:hypothetical protein